MDFEVTNVIDGPANRRRICIEKRVAGFPYFAIPTKDHVYEAFDATGFRKTRDTAFSAMSEFTGELELHRRFIQNDTFIADTLEVALPREIERDLGFRQHVNLTVLQLHGKSDPTTIVELAKEDEQDCLQLVKDLYTKNNLSNNLLSYRLMEMMMVCTAGFLQVKKPMFKVVSNPFGLVVNFRSLHANGDEMFTYALGVKHKRSQR